MKEEETIIFSLGDVVRLLKKHWKKLVLCSILLPFLVVCSIPTYFETKIRIVAISSVEESHNSVTDILPLSLKQDHSILELKQIMKNRKVVQATVQKLGLQIADNNQLQLMRNFYNNLSCSHYSDISFQDVIFEGTQPLNLLVLFIDNKNLIIQNERKQILAKSSLGQKIKLKNIEFKIVKAPTKLSFNTPYRFKILPLEKTIDNVLSQLTIKQDKESSKVLLISFKSPGSANLKKVLPNLVEEAQKHLCQLYAQKLDENISSLKIRQKELQNELFATISKYENYLTQNILQKKGQIDLKNEEIASLIPYQNTCLSLLDVQQRAKYLEKSPAIPYFTDKKALEALLEQKAELMQEKNHLFASLKDLSIPHFIEFESLNLEETKSLLLSYNQKLDSCRLKILELTDCNHPEIEIATLKTLLDGTLIKDTLEKAIALELLIKDEKNCTPKEVERWQSDLQLYKQFLLKEIESHLIKAKNEAALFEKKIGALQGVLLSKINQKIVFVEKMVEEETQKQKCYLKAEEECLVSKALSLQDALKNFPQKWSFEKKFEFSLESELIKLNNLLKLLEEKKLTKDLKNYQKDILDIDIEHKTPLETPALPLALLMIIVGPFFPFLFYFAKNLFSGFPLSPNLLAAKGEIFCGFLNKKSALKKYDDLLEERTLFFKIALALENQKALPLCVGIIGNGLDSSYLIATALAKMGKKVCLLKEEKGVKQEPFLQKGEYDFYPILWGNGSSFLELRNIINELKPKYDYILLFSKESPAAIEPKIFLPLCDKMIITFKEEPWIELAPFMKDKTLFIGNIE